MKKLLFLSVILVLGTSLFAGTPHTVMGTVNAGGSAPAAFQFNAFIDTRPGEILTETSTGCGYNGGYYFINVGNFATQWAAGDQIVIQNECLTMEPLDYYGEETGTLTTDPVDNLGEWVLLDCIVPVELTSFQAEMQEEFAAISWITETESDMNCFNIYRDELLIHTEDATNSSQTTNYEFIDMEVENGATYIYDLEAVNLDGTAFTIGSTTLTIVIEPPDEFSNVTALYNNYPNPFKGTTAIKYAVKEGMTASLTIYNAKGQIVDTYTLGQTGVNGAEQVWNADTSGIYFYKLESEGISQVKKMLVLK